MHESGRAVARTWYVPTDAAGLTWGGLEVRLEREGSRAAILHRIPPADGAPGPANPGQWNAEYDALYAQARRWADDWNAGGVRRARALQRRGSTE